MIRSIRLVYEWAISLVARRLQNEQIFLNALSATGELTPEATLQNVLRLSRQTTRVIYKLDLPEGEPEESEAMLIASRGCGLYGSEFTVVIPTNCRKITDYLRFCQPSSIPKCVAIPGKALRPLWYRGC
jgi:hypothetical protein